MHTVRLCCAPVPQPQLYIHLVSERKAGVRLQQLNIKSFTGNDPFEKDKYTLKWCKISVELTFPLDNSLSNVELLLDEQGGHVGYR